MRFNALKGFIRENCMTYEEFADKLGISKSSIWSKLNGRSEWTRVEMLLIKERFNLTGEDIIRLFCLN